jgi:hypothetical protein
MIDKMTKILTLTLADAKTVGQCLLEFLNKLQENHTCTFSLSLKLEMSFVQALINNMPSNNIGMKRRTKNAQRHRQLCHGMMNG